ncbi:hypothetical protein N431DRAFT_457794 [Stipitochalara longipes BDJ]|nr:hypothetical protein N431DRAFT_457794 [Stipitochalara longipes BDJ]
MSQDFLRWEAFHNGCPMPLKSNMWGGAVGQYQLPNRQLAYPVDPSMSAPMQDQREFFNGEPMSFAMRDRWSQGFGTYGPYGKHGLNPNAVEFAPLNQRLDPNAAEFVPPNLRMNPNAEVFVPRFR